MFRSRRFVPTLNEGLASYLEERAVEQIDGRPVLDKRANQLMEWLKQRAAQSTDLRNVPLADYGRHQRRHAVLLRTSRSHG